MSSPITPPIDVPVTLPITPPIDVPIPLPSLPTGNTTTATPTPTTSITSTSQSTATSTTLALPTTTNVENQNSYTNSIIIGASIGGRILVLLIALTIFSRKRKRQDPIEVDIGSVLKQRQASTSQLPSQVPTTQIPMEHFIPKRVYYEEAPYIMQPQPVVYYDYTSGANYHANSGVTFIAGEDSTYPLRENSNYQMNYS